MAAIDLMISIISIEHELTLVTNDEDFNTLQNIEPNLHIIPIEKERKTINLIETKIPLELTEQYSLNLSNLYSVSILLRWKYGDVKTGILTTLSRIFLHIFN